MPTPPITTLHIQGFKSLVDVQLQPRQLNLFIGKPNVGKSNILEALSLLGAGYSRGEKFMGEFIRYEEPNQLFTDGVPKGDIKVESNLGKAWLRMLTWRNEIVVTVGPPEYVDAAYDLYQSTGTDEELPARHYLETVRQGIEEVSGEYQWPIPMLEGRLLADGKISSSDLRSYYSSTVRRYEFARNRTQSARQLGHLIPPHGDNLFEVMLASKKLRQATNSLFSANNHQFVLRTVDRTLETQKNIDGDVYTYPYSLIADTFQRLIFYLAAIESNEGSVLLFEEPEAHSFPAYIAQLAERIAEDVRAGRNQYFITTHSPYLLDLLLENTSADQVAVFIVDYADYQTVVTQLPDDQLGHLLDLSSDVFFNLHHLPLTDAGAR